MWIALLALVLAAPAAALRPGHGPGLRSDPPPFDATTIYWPDGQSRSPWRTVAGGVTPRRLLVRRPTTSRPPRARGGDAPGCTGPLPRKGRWTADQGSRSHDSSRTGRGGGPCARRPCAIRNALLARDDLARFERRARDRSPPARSSSVHHRLGRAAGPTGRAISGTAGSDRHPAPFSPACRRKPPDWPLHYAR
jgi:hypothetical protein